MEFLCLEQRLQINIKEATKEDLPYILELYKQPDMDDGEVLPHNDYKILGLKNIITVDSLRLSGVKNDEWSVEDAITKI